MDCKIAHISSITALGAYPDSCAAALAGLVGARGSPDFELFFRGDEEPRQIPVAAAPITSHGFSGVGRLVALLHSGFLGLAPTDAERRELLRTPWFLAVPDPFEREIEPKLDNADQTAARVAWLGQTLMERCLLAAGIADAPQSCRFYGGDRTSFVDALRDARSALEQGAAKRCVVGAVDSLLSPDVRDALAANNLLRTPTNGYGLTAGEGAVLFVLDTATRSLVAVAATSLGPKQPHQTAERGDGKGFAAMIAGALAATKAPASPYMMVVDQNGERERIVEWGDALVELVARGAATSMRSTLTPAINFGDAGVAGLAIAMSLGTHAISRRSDIDKALIAASSFQSALCGAVVLERG